jgi:hypothetical protein
MTQNPTRRGGEGRGFYSWLRAANEMRSRHSDILHQSLSIELVSVCSRFLGLRLEFHPVSFLDSTIAPTFIKLKLFSN